MSDKRVEGALNICENILEMLEELPEAAMGFAVSVEEKTKNMRDWIENKEYVTDKQYTALENMKSGCEKWMYRN